MISWHSMCFRVLSMTSLRLVHVLLQVLECCKQFGELPPDLAEKIKYAKVMTSSSGRNTLFVMTPAHNCLHILSRNAISTVLSLRLPNCVVGLPSFAVLLFRSQVRFVEIAKATKERRPPAPPREAEPLPGMNDDADEFPSSSLSSLPNVSQPDPGGNPGEGVAPPSYLSLPEAPVVQSPTTPSAPVFPPPPPSAGEWPDPTVAPPPLPPNALPTSPARMPVNMVMPTRHNTYKPTVAQMRDAMGR
mgnify:CR=1 FL=1